MTSIDLIYERIDNYERGLREEGRRQYTEGVISRMAADGVSEKNIRTWLNLSSEEFEAVRRSDTAST